VREILEANWRALELTKGSHVLTSKGTLVLPILSKGNQVRGVESR